MSLEIQYNHFINSDIREALSILTRVGSNRKLGIARWDNVLDVYPYAGTVVIPIKLGFRVFSEPFYFIVEKMNEKESLRIKPLKGDQWSLGDVYGFFGLSGFTNFSFDWPIFIVEGASDWAVIRRYYPFVLSSNTAWLSNRQCFFLSSLSKNIFLGYDADETGGKNSNKAVSTLKKFGCNVTNIHPAQKDWGHMFENDFGRELLDRTMNNFLEIIKRLE